jgi:trimeric autotransporter adhesin
MTVPNIFGSATSAIPLSQLDQNFATAITLGNTAVYLGNTTTSLGNVPSITTTGDTNTGIFFPAADTIAFSEGGAEAMRIDSSGNVGIGTSSPASRLNIATGAAAPCTFTLTSNNTGTGAGDRGRLDFYSADNSGVAYQLGYMDYDRADGTGTASYIAWANRKAGTVSESMRIDSSGNVGIGTTAPSSVLNVKSGAPVFRLETTGTVSSTGTASYAIRDSTGADVFSYGYLGLANCFQFSTIPAAGFMRFLTGAQVEAMRIDSSGNVLVGQASGNADARVSIDAGSTDSSPVIDFRKGSATTTTAQVYARFFCNGGAVATGSITANGVSAATFTGYSDRRLKENIVDLPSQLSNIMALRPVEFDFKGYENGEGHQIGFIAQEVQEIYPDSVGEGADGMLTLSDMNKNDARLIKCIQEMKTIMDAQATTITALTARIKRWRTNDNHLDNCTT